MAERPELPADTLLFADALVTEWAEHMSGQFAELAELLRTPRGVREVPSDRWQCATVLVSTDKAEQLLGFQPDRARVTLRNVGTVSVSISSQAGFLLTQNAGRLELLPNDVITLPTRGAVHVLGHAAGATLAYVVEEYDT